jgi:hypothetical protein
VQYREVSAILLVILAMDTLADSFSGFLRNAAARGTGQLDSVLCRQSGRI